MIDAPIEELDVVALKADWPELGLKAGDRGAVVMLYGDEACEIEFVNPKDGTTDVMTAFKLKDVELVWQVASIRDVEPPRAKSA